MAAKFVVIRFAEMHEFMVGEGFKLLNPSGVLPDFVKSSDCVVGLGLAGTHEYVYGKRVYRRGGGGEYTLRVYTSVDVASGVTRGIGSDAIRVVLFHRHVVEADGIKRAYDPVPCGGEKIVKRVMGWRKNLKSRLEKYEDQFGPDCVKCGRAMVLRHGKYGDFWGCSGYGSVDSCSNTVRLGRVNNPVCVCSRVMVLRSGSRGNFWGCEGYPICRGVRSVAA